MFIKPWKKDRDSMIMKKAVTPEATTVCRRVPEDEKSELSSELGMT
jgi:hypothetical protein